MLFLSQQKKTLPKFLIGVLAFLMVAIPLLQPLPSLAAISGTFTFNALPQSVIASQFVSLLDFEMSEMLGGATFNSMKVTLTGSPTIVAGDFSECFLIQDSTDPGSDVFDILSGDNYWVWPCGTPGVATTYDLATDMDVDGPGPDTTSTPGVASIPTSMVGRGSYEFNFGVAISSTPTSDNAFKLQRETGVNGQFVASTGTLSTVILQESGIVSLPNTTPPTITGGGPGNGQDFVPDQAFIDAIASKALNGVTVNTSSVTLYPCTGATDALSCATPNTITNLCTSATLANSTQIICLHDALAASTTYRFQVGTGVQDGSGNALDSTLTRIFRTGNILAGENTTDPHVVSSIPMPGSHFPAGGNLTLDFPLGPEGNINFNTGDLGASDIGDINYCAGGACAISLKKIVNFIPTTEVCVDAVSCAVTWNSTTRRATINPASNLEVAASGAASIEYEMCVRGNGNELAMENSAFQSIPFDQCTRFFTTAADATPPTLATTGATNPANGASDVSPYSTDLSVRFSEKLDPSTVSLATVRLCADSTVVTAGCETLNSRLTDTTKFMFMFDSFDNAVRLNPIASDALADNTKYCFEVVGGESGVKDLSGNAFATTTSANCFTTGTASDLVPGGPRVSYVDADNFKGVIGFNEPIRFEDLISGGTVNTSNVALECPVGVTVPLTGKSAIYRGDAKELAIEGLGLPVDQTCRFTVTNARDLSGNTMDTSSSNNVGNFIVLNSALTNGFLGGGAPASNDFFGGTGGQTAGTFWERPQRAEPLNKSIGKATKVIVEFPVPGAMPVGSTVLLTFPSGFTLSTIDGTARLVPGAQSPSNSDWNGPESGTVTGSASVDTAAKTITLTTIGAALAENQMVHFELDRITTPASAVDNIRITIINKNSSGIKIGQTINPAPFNIQEGGNLSISGTVCKGSSSSGVCEIGDSGIPNAQIFCNQMGSFEVEGTAAKFMGHQETKTNASGDFTLSGLSPGQYGCTLPPNPTALADTGGAPPFQNVLLTSTSKTDVDFKLKDMATALDVKTLTATISGGPANETLDVFCHGGASDFAFSAPVMKSVTLDGSGNGSTTLKLQQGNNYECGAGPHIAFESFSSGGPPPIPTFTFMPPKPQQVTMSTDKEMTFALTESNRTISGSVRDGSANGIANVFVHADPVGCFDASTGEIKDCFGAFTQTKSDGTFVLNVSDGTYQIGADGPGMPSSTNTIANVKGANVTGVALKIVKSSTTISGAVQDESGNGIAYAHINAERRTILSGSDACDFQNSQPSGGFADTPTDSNGNFTLYAAAGTWCLRAFSPAYGEVGTRTVTVVASSLSGQNIAATAANYGTISGTVTKSATNLSGAFINCFGSNGGNMAQSGSDGTYSMKMKLSSTASTTVTCDGFAPGVGPLGRSTLVFTLGQTTKTQNFTLAGNPGTITVTATGLTEGFCDARDSSGVGSGAPIEFGIATLKAPAGTYTIRCGTRKTGPLTLSPSSVILTASGTASVTATVPTLRTVTGRVTDGTNNLEGVTANFSETTTKASFVLVSGNQSGTTNNLTGSTIPEGVYNVRVSKRGYEPTTTTATISGGNFTFASTIALTPASGDSGTTVALAIQADAVAYTGSAKAICTKDSKVIVADIDSTTGTASADLTNGTWGCKAIGDNGKQSATSSVIVAGGTLTGDAPTLSLATNITGYTAKSESGTLGLSTGGLLKFNDLEVGGAAPELNIPANALSTTDSSTGNVEMKTDPTLADINPGADQNFVGSSGYEITPKDANGKKISDINSNVTLTIPYTDADVTAAGVDESKLVVATFDASSQTWETVSTTVDTVNNLLIASISHFSSYGVLGGVSAPTPAPASSGSTSGGGGSYPSTQPAQGPTVVVAPTPNAPVVETKSTESTSVIEAFLINHLEDVNAVLEQLGLTRKIEDEIKYLPLIKADAKAFGVELTAAQETLMTNFVSYGVSDATKKIGSGERRAVLRDYFDTVGRADVKWADIERMTKGEKPVFRNLIKEQAQIEDAIKRFEKIIGHRPNFKDAKEDLLWNTFMYRIRFTRDLEKEKKAIGQFKALFKYTPTTPMDWAAVRGIGYVVNE